MNCTGIKKIVYADPSVVTADLTPASLKTIIQAAIEATNVVSNVHGESWQIEESEASSTGYKNQLTGKNYRIDVVEGDINVAFTVGEYDYATKANLLGGSVIVKGGEGEDKNDAVGWKRPTKNIGSDKALFCLTDDNVWFVYPKARVVTREANTDKAVALAVKGIVLEPTTTGVASEYNFDESEVAALTA